MAKQNAIVFVDNSKNVINTVDKITIGFLHEAKSVVSKQASRNSPVQSGDLKRSFESDSYVDDGENVAYIGSTVKYSIYQELGTGEYASGGNGRKGGWFYRDPKTGKCVFTRGTQPKHMLRNAFISKEKVIEQQAKKRFKEGLKK